MKRTSKIFPSRQLFKTIKIIGQSALHREKDIFAEIEIRAFTTFLRMQATTKSHREILFYLKVKHRPKLRVTDARKDKDYVQMVEAVGCNDQRLFIFTPIHLQGASKLPGILRPSFLLPFRRSYNFTSVSYLFKIESIISLFFSSSIHSFGMLSFQQLRSLQVWIMFYCQLHILALKKLLFRLNKSSIL